MILQKIQYLGRIIDCFWVKMHFYLRICEKNRTFAAAKVN